MIESALSERGTRIRPSEWPVHLLSDIARFDAGRTPSRAEPSFWSAQNGSGIPWVTISDMTPHSVIQRTSETITPRALKEVFRGRIVPKGTLLMSFKLTIGRTATLGMDACHNEAIVSIYPGPLIDQKYLEFYLSQVDYRRYQDRAVKGNTLNQEKIARIEVLVPPLAVQEAIVASLTTIHQAIELADAHAAGLRRLFTSARHELLHADAEESALSSVREAETA
ncbi:MAG: restriction endonuclease subunit S [Sandaracinaceae bacterium]|nr:restriction endonuclease subunit S [Sandaracinaceae bacterium]